MGIIRYRFNTADRDELDAFVALMWSDSAMTGRMVCRFGSRYWRLDELTAAADCVARYQVRNLM